MIKINKKNKGFTLVEILLVVGFIALASVGVYTIYSKVQLSSGATTESRNLDTIRAGIKQLYGANHNYGTLSNTVVNAGRITPDNMKTAPNSTDSVITNSFGGVVTIAPANLGGGTNNGFSITYNGVPAGVCTKLVSTGGSQFDQVTVAGTVVKTYGTGVIREDVLTVTCNATADSVIRFDSI